MTARRSQTPCSPRRSPRRDCQRPLPRLAATTKDAAERDRHRGTDETRAPPSRGLADAIRAGAAFHRELKPVPDAAEAVKRVSAAGIAVCVASQGRLSKALLTLGLTGLRDLFPAAALFSAEAVLRGKPHPDIYLHAASTMGAKPSRCIVVEDTPSGVTAAVSAGMRAIGYVADSDETALRAAGAEVRRSMRELPRLLGLIR